MSSPFPERLVSRAWWAIVALVPLLGFIGAVPVRAPEVVPAAEAAVPAPVSRPANAPLRVCADPNNLPFSNEKREGFENRIVELLARDMGRKIEYTWWPQQRGYVRKSLKAGLCDVIPGVAASMDMLLTTRPYYRSTYVFVQKRSARHRVTSFDDPALRHMTIGVQLIGDDGANTPPAHALGRRGIIANVRGYHVYGDYGTPNPPARIVDAVERGEVDVAVVWGPLAGYFARRSRVPLQLTPVSPQVDLPFLPFVFDIAMGVRRTDKAMQEQLEDAMTREESTIARILDQYGIPRIGGVPRARGATQ